MSQQEFYAGRASGIRHAIGLLDVLANDTTGRHLGAKSLAARVKKTLTEVMEEERHLVAPAEPDSLSSPTAVSGLDNIIFPEPFRDLS